MIFLVETLGDTSHGYMTKVTQLVYTDHHTVEVLLECFELDTMVTQQFRLGAKTMQRLNHK